jgi:hypothetical protein
MMQLKKLVTIYENEIVGVVGESRLRKICFGISDYGVAAT